MPKHPSPTPTPNPLLPRTLAGALLLGSLLVYASPEVRAQNVRAILSDFTTPVAPAGWLPLGAACMTAGTSNDLYASERPRLDIPSCKRVDRFGLAQNGGNSGTLNLAPDPDGRGALRMSNSMSYIFGQHGDKKDTGGIVAQQTMRTNAGLNIVFTAMIYAGNNAGGTGGDGFNFFIADAGPDGTYADPMSNDPEKKLTLGADGGGQGYVCTNPKYSLRQEGMSRGYMALVVDNWGGFLADYWSSRGAPNGRGVEVPNRVGIRGPGDITWRSLNRRWPQYFPSRMTQAQRNTIVSQTCFDGFVTDWSPLPGGAPIPRPDIPVDNYKFLVGSDKVMNDPLAPLSQSSTRERRQAKPITYSLRLTPEGLLSFGMRYNNGVLQPILRDYDVRAESPLPETMRFGFLGTAGGSHKNVHELLCFNATPAEFSGSSADTNATDEQTLRTDTQVYTATYSEDRWWGRVQARTLVFNPTLLTVSVGPVNWDAHCNLTGGKCDSLGDRMIAAQTPDRRQILSWNGKSGVPLKWDALSGEQQAALNGADGAGARRLAYYRGNRSDEITIGAGGALTGTLRPRTGILGDIQGASPTSLADPSPNLFPEQFLDRLHGNQTGPETGWKAFARTQAGRVHTVFAAANDGMLHAFRSGRMAGGQYETLLNDGFELFSYMPGQIVSSMHTANQALDYSHPLYAHKRSVDATPGLGDVFYSGQWHSWLVGTLGAGGRGIYALDVTRPDAINEGSAVQSVIGEWTADTLVCANDAACGGALGFVSGQPMFRRLHDGTWAAIFGNGAGSTRGTAGVFIMHVDRGGNTTFRYIDTQVGSAANPNGMSTLASADLDGDQITDYLYGGDLQGNLWRIDLTSTRVSDWEVSTYGSGGPRPLFKAPAGAPITVRPAVAAVQTKSSADDRVMVYVGTGQRNNASLTEPGSFAQGNHAVYGLWDWDMTGWNDTLKASKRYASLPASPVTTPAMMVTQTLTGTGPGAGGLQTRTVTDNPVCWKGSSACPGGNENMGWRVVLDPADAVVGMGEQIVAGGIVYENALLVNSVLPVAVTGGACSPEIPSGYSMAFNLATGGRTRNSVFDNPANPPSSYTAGIQTGAVGAPEVLTVTPPGSTESISVMISASSNASAPPDVRRLFMTPTQGKRISWIERR